LSGPEAQTTRPRRSRRVTDPAARTPSRTPHRSGASRAPSGMRRTELPASGRPTRRGRRGARASSGTDREAWWQSTFSQPLRMVEVPFQPTGGSSPRASAIGRRARVGGSGWSGAQEGGDQDECRQAGRMRMSAPRGGRVHTPRTPFVFGASSTSAMTAATSSRRIAPRLPSSLDTRTRPVPGSSVSEPGSTNFTAPPRSTVRLRSGPLPGPAPAAKTRLADQATGAVTLRGQQLQQAQGDLP
jgi:hypothetical protein